MKMNESLIKYLSGLLDADGSLTFQFRLDRTLPDLYFTGLQLNLHSSAAIDKQGFIASLTTLTEMGGFYQEQEGKYHKWTVSKRADLERLLPRLVKHMCIKANHWQWMLETWREKRGELITREETEALRVASKDSRASRRGPIKPKNHPTWAWLAGYLDGDGWYRHKCYVSDYARWMIRVGAVAHGNDKAVLEFIQQAHGGAVRPHGQSPNVFVWDRGLGPTDRSFALRFLPNLAKHARLKKHKIEAIIHFHRQRLSAEAPAGEATV